MNWVGGSRSRLVMRNNAKKQREFFEKKRMEQKLKKLGINLPTSSSGHVGSGSTDLMTLLIVNQIATKKANQDPPKVAVFGSSKKSLKFRRNEAAVLPMSPCSPSKLCLADSNPHYSFQGMQTRKTVNHQGFKCGQLSPVLESAFSDNSASDYLPPRTNPATPSSSPSSLSSGIFQFQMNPQNEISSQVQVIPPLLPWDDGQQSRQFQPFSQPRSMTEAYCWSNTSEPPLFQIHTCTPARGFFGSPEPGNRMNTDEGLDLSLSQEDSEHVTHEDVFRRFCQDENGREGFHCEGVKSKICLTEQTSIRPSGLQTVPESQSVVAEFYKNADLNTSPPGQKPHPVSEYSWSCSGIGGYYSSDSNDDEHCCEHVSSSYTAHACCSNHFDQALLSPKLPQSRPPTPSTSSSTSLKDEQQILKDGSFLKTASRGQMVEIKSPAVCLSLDQSPKPCGCRKAQTQDAAAQTVSVRQPETRDVATQCGKTAISPCSLHQLDVEGVSGRRSHAEPQEAPVINLR